MYEQKTPLRTIKRTPGIPTEFPFKCYFATPDDIPEAAPDIIVGMDSGISNLAFSEIEIIRDPITKSVVDFKYVGSYYFLGELSKYKSKIQKQLHIMELYYELFSHKRVIAVGYELLPFTIIKDEKIRAGVLDAQVTTDYIKLVAYQLNHHMEAIGATKNKFVLTGNGQADKEEMCKNAFALTQDEMLLDIDHCADAFALAFCLFMDMLKQDSVDHGTPIPSKFAHMTWNFDKKKMPKPTWEQQPYPHNGNVS